MAPRDSSPEKRPEVCHITGIGAILEKQPDHLRVAVLARFEDRIIEEFSLPMDILGFHDRYFVGNDYLALKNEGEKDVVEMKMETQATHEDWFDGPLYFAQLQYLFTKDNSDDDEYSDLELYLVRRTHDDATPTTTIC